MSVVDDSFDRPMKLEEKSVMNMAGGIAGYGYQCGMLWGGALAAGAEAYRRYGPGPQAETAAVQASQRLIKAFRTQYKEINCFEIIKLNWKGSGKPGFGKQVLKFLFRGGPIGCFRMAAGYAPLAYQEINAAFTDLAAEALPEPVSCTALLAQKMGASELHTVMAAGLAGGIGLSSGACGALGAAIWILEMDHRQNGGAGPMNLDDPIAVAAIEKFLESSGYEFECEKITGRKFTSVTEHAEYMHAGGCVRIIEALAAK